VRTAEGAIEIDELGKETGRGAYLCRNEACWVKCMKENKLEHALHVNMTDDDKKRLVSQAEVFIKRE